MCIENYLRWFNEPARSIKGKFSAMINGATRNYDTEK